ncbi:type II toxin-antitoxin system HicB family antitoxin [Methylomicrobium lacus]|uniref:type II toxin-antitoxin system HicB family antitoxin n=1 Tax=Methylomicrobium lacus TaxID=136992 RepID=UPI0035A85F7F
MKFIAIIQASNKGLAKNYSAYCPDIPGCIAYGPTEEETLAALQAILAQQIGHLEKLGIEPPNHHCTVKIFEVEIREEEQNAPEFANLNRLY